MDVSDDDSDESHVPNLISNQKVIEQLFALDDDDSCSDTASLTTCDEFDSLDACLDAYNLGTYIRSQTNPNKRQRVGPVPADMRPLAFARLNTSLGKPEPKTIKVLLDSGASESLVTAEHVKKLRARGSKTKPTTWTTPAGEMTTQSKVKVQFTLPELQENKLIEWNVHVVDNMGAYDMIIGRDIMSFLGIDIRFSDQVVTWEGAEMPFKPLDATVETHYQIDEVMAVSKAKQLT